MSLIVGPHCHVCGAALTAEFCADIVRRRVSLGMTPAEPKLCAGCVWERICRMADANAPIEITEE